MVLFSEAYNDCFVYGMIQTDIESLKNRVSAFQIFRSLMLQNRKMLWYTRKISLKINTFHRKAKNTKMIKFVFSTS